MASEDYILHLKANLLDNLPGQITDPGDLNASLNARGLYSPYQFVLRLSPEVHRQLAALPSGIVYGEMDSDSVQAFSTYLHETVHWWQHIGSSAGFVRSLSYPAQAHANYKHLKHLLATVGPKKSIEKLLERLDGPSSPGTPAGLANTIVNNHYDIEFFRFLTFNQARARQAIANPFFDCVGHSFATTYANILMILAATCDEHFCVLPDPRPWENEFAMLRQHKEEGYYFGSDIKAAELGVHEIFEGQARFAQLQYLFFASGKNLSWEDVRSHGMLDGVYGKAFEAFLQGTEIDWPPSIDHPSVALFLLVCDLSINPGEGFPLPLQYFSSFVTDVDPGMRFLFFCRTIATERPDLVRAIVDYSRAEYFEVAQALTQPLILISPLKIAETVERWVNDNDGLRSLMAEHETFDFSPRNLSLRVLFSHYLAFNIDKLAKPEFFCWPGAWMVGQRLSSDIVTLFDRHSALFVDKADDGSIFPRILSGKNESLVHQTFESFYSFNVTYDMTRQWIAVPGQFNYDYSWLSSSGSPGDSKGFADRHFEMIYGVHPDAFEIV
jgi:hypothetical protein